MKIKLTHDTAVRFRKGDVLEVEESEAKRLIAFNSAIKEEEEPKKKTTKKAAKK